MAKIKTIRCPQCSGISPEKIAEGEYKCIYCGSLFHVEEKRPVNFQDVFKTMSGRQPTQLKPEELVRVKRIVRIVVFSIIISTAAGVIIPFMVANQSATTSSTSEGIEQESGWQAASPESKKYFVGSKGAVMWKMMKESGERMDSARYTLLTIDLKSGKRLSSQRWTKTMTWRDGFDFSKNYYNSVFAIGDTVWVLSAENRIDGYNLYTGKKMVTAEMLEDAYKEFAPGISEVTEIYNKPAMEVKTDDGFTYSFMPRTKTIMEREKFNDYIYKNKSKKTFYTLTEGTRPVLWKVRMDIPLYEISSSISHWLGDSRHNKTDFMVRSYGVEILDSVPTTTIFYKGKVMSWDDKSAVVMYRESMAKKAAALVVRIGDDGTVLWKTSLDQVKGLSDVFKNDQYIQYFMGEKELVIVHESANLIIAGVDVKTGKINWTVFEGR